MSAESSAFLSAIIAASKRRRPLTTVRRGEIFTASFVAWRNHAERTATAPKLAHAISALAYLVDGEEVELDADGRPVGDPPFRWPKQGLIAAVLAKHGTRADAK